MNELGTFDRVRYQPRQHGRRYDLGSLQQAVQRAAVSTPTMLYFDDPGFQWPRYQARTEHGDEFRVYFVLSHMMTTVFGHCGPCNVKWSAS